MYKENDVEIKPTIAGLLCSAIISDTLLFRSPTCTPLDEKIAKKLAKIAGINLEEQAQAMFKAGSSLSGKTAEDICFQDFKQITVNDMVFGVGQLNSMSKEELQKVKEMLTPYLPKVLEKNGVQMVFFMLTDILDESTELLCCGARAKEYIIDAFDLKENTEKMILTNKPFGVEAGQVPENAECWKMLNAGLGDVCTLCPSTMLYGTIAVKENAYNRC